jgi:Tfp pilus assembly protein PilP
MKITVERLTAGFYTVKLNGRIAGVDTNKAKLTEFIENDEVEACERFGETPLPSGPAFSLKTVHEIDDIEEAAA